MSEPQLEEVKRDVPKRTPEDLKALLRIDRNNRETKAALRIKEILEEERCEMIPVITLSSKGMLTRIDIVALD